MGKGGRTVVVRQLLNATKPQTWTLDFSVTPLLTSRQAGDLGVADRCEDYRRSERGRRSHTCSHGFPEVLACEAGLGAELFLDPVGECEPLN